MYTLPELGIKFISLNYCTSERVDRYGNQMRYVGNIVMLDGAHATMNICDVYFGLIRNPPGSN
jgi:hypothetical protein